MPEETPNPLPVEASAKTSLFVVALQTANTEGQIIWGRYSAMLAANAFFGVLLAAITRQKLDRPETLVVIVVSIVGGYLCWLWLQLANRGWGNQDRWRTYARTFDWNGTENPLKYVEAIPVPGISVRIIARRVIYLFGSIYATTFTYALIRLFLL